MSTAASTAWRGWQTRRTLGLLDIGSSKIACLIVATHPPLEHGAPGARVLGGGSAPSRGLSEARVVALEAAEQAVRSAVEEAERTAGVRLKDVLVAVPGVALKSHRFTAHTRLGGPVVAPEDLARLMAGGRSYAERDGRTLVEIACHGYRLDDAAGITEPEGLAGQRLAADLGAVTADAAQLTNLLHVVERAYLRPVMVASAPCASARVTTSADERRRGVMVADLGAGATSVALFLHGRLAALASIPLGGDHITSDIARELGISGREAERLKRACGSVAETDDVAGAAGTESCAETPAAAPAAVSDDTRVRELVRGSLRELCGRLGTALASSGIPARSIACAVLTGGASQQPGLTELAGQLLGLSVRQARVEQLPGLPDTFAGPAFATAVGLARVARDAAVARRADRRPDQWRGRAPDYLTRIGQWLAESF